MMAPIAAHAAPEGRTRQPQCGTFLRVQGITAEPSGMQMGVQNYNYVVTIAGRSNATVRFILTFLGGPQVTTAGLQNLRINRTSDTRFQIGTGTNPNINTGTVRVVYDGLVTQAPSLGVTGCTTVPGG